MGTGADNGGITRLQSYRRSLNEALVQNFPELGEHLMESSLHTAAGGAHDAMKMEEDTAGPSGGMANGA